jgi:hypothetical protein
MCKPVMVKQNQGTTFGHSTAVEPAHFFALSFAPCSPSLLSLLSGRPRDGAGTAPANRANHSVNTALGRWDGKIHHSRAHTLFLPVPSVSICVHLWSSPCPPAGEFPFHPGAPPQPEIACDSLSQPASITCDSLSQPVFFTQPISGHLRSSQPISGENEIPPPRGMKTSVTNM